MVLIAKLSLAVAIVALAVGAARADTIRYQNGGTPNTIAYSFTAQSTGDVIAYFAGSTAGYEESLGLMDNGVLTSAGFGLDDHTASIGQSFDLGHVTAGDKLTFVLDITSPSLGYVYSDPTMNAAYDGSIDTGGYDHIYSAAYKTPTPSLPGVPAGTYVAFEDLPFSTANFDYFDETFVVTNVATNAPAKTAVPEAGTVALIGAGLGVMALLRRRKPARI
ncbi:MAG TPA: PEP-CTERM sorting domain-containing protein [Aliidongia sp.]|nr:PEP-CTERM sorting domain-containing protein [Aliidongia sp.]